MSAGRQRTGFTLIELLITMTIIVVLAGIALARFNASKERAYLATMQADLKNLMSAQMAFHDTQDPPLWAQSIAELGARFRASAGVTVAMPNVTGTGFGAVARHNATNLACAVYVGDAVTAPASEEGVIACASCPGWPVCSGETTSVPVGGGAGEGQGGAGQGGGNRNPGNRPATPPGQAPGGPPGLAPGGPPGQQQRP